MAGRVRSGWGKIFDQTKKSMAQKGMGMEAIGATMTALSFSDRQGETETSPIQRRGAMREFNVERKCKQSQD
jgi:hypothetical protein